MPGERYGCRCGIEWLDDSDVSPNTTQEQKVIANVPKDISNKIDKVYENAVSGTYLENRLTVNLGALPRKTVHRINKSTGFNLKGFDVKVDGEAVWHNQKGHGVLEQTKKGQVIITREKLKLLYHIMTNFDAVYVERKKAGSVRFLFEKDLKSKYKEVFVYGKNKKHLLFKTLFGKQ